MQIGFFEITEPVVDGNELKDEAEGKYVGEGDEVEGFEEGISDDAIIECLSCSTFSTFCEDESGHPSIGVTS